MLRPYFLNAGPLPDGPRHPTLSLHLAPAPNSTFLRGARVSPMLGHQIDVQVGFPNPPDIISYSPATFLGRSASPGLSTRRESSSSSP
jgi:hypothetical protein